MLLLDQVPKPSSEQWHKKYFKLLWLKNILDDLEIKGEGTIRYCNSRSTKNIAHNHMQRDQREHVEIDRHFIKEKLESDLVCIPYVSAENQLAESYQRAYLTFHFIRTLAS